MFPFRTLHTSLKEVVPERMQLEEQQQQKKKNQFPGCATSVLLLLLHLQEYLPLHLLFKD